jgi:hypothetical protein
VLNRNGRALLTTALLALLLAFGSEALLWPAQPTHDAIDWLAAGISFPCTALILLWLATRFRMRDVYGLMALAGIYGIAYGVLIHPAYALVDVPRTWFTRVLGAHTLAGLVMLLLFLALMPVISRRRVIVTGALSAVVGLAWGIWGRWSPTLADVPASETPLVSLLAALVMFTLAIGLTLALLARQPQSEAPLMFAPPAILGAGVGLAAILVIRLAQGSTDGLSLLVLSTFAALSVGVLYYQQRRKGTALLDPIGRLPARGWPLLMGVAVALLAAGMIVGYGPPRGEGVDDPVLVISVIFTAYGIAWLPAVTAILAARAFIRLARQGRL